MGSQSDFEAMKGASEVMDEFQVEYEIRVVSAHRTPKMMLEYAEKASSRGIEVIIAGAGGAGPLNPVHDGNEVTDMGKSFNDSMIVWGFVQLPEAVIKVVGYFHWFI